MELGDFSYFVMVPILLIPLVSIYYGLRILRWEFPDRLFLDSWSIWLVWLASGIVSYFLLLMFTSRLNVYWGIPAFGWFFLSIGAALIANVIAIGSFVGLIRRYRLINTAGLFEDIKPKPIYNSSALRISLLTSFAATGSFGFLFGLLLIAGNIYDHYYPPKFGLYDI
jgi:hypothetical protein